MFTNKTKKSFLKAILTKKAPIYVQFAVTKNCNLRCEMCDSNSSRENEVELNLKEIEKLTDVLDKLNTGVVLLTGGEPFLRKDITEIIRLFASKGFTVRLQSNGWFADESAIKDAYNAGMNEITISLDSLDPEKHDSIRGTRGSWQKAIESIARFSQILPAQGTFLGINTVVCKKNLDEITSIIRFVTEIGFFSSLIPVHLANSDSDFIIRKEAPELAFQPTDFDKIDEVYKEILKMKKDGFNIFNSRLFLEKSPSFLKGQRVKWHCDSPNLYFAISPSGKFLPCVDLKTSISMLDDNFVKVYRSKEFKTRIQQMVNSCPGCFYACWPEMSFLCRNFSVLAERIILGMKTSFKKRKPVTYEDCIKIIDRIKK